MGIEERKERDKEFRRHQILDAATNMFAKKGFSGATIENIAEAADYTEFVSAVLPVTITAATMVGTYGPARSPLPGQ